MIHQQKKQLEWTTPLCSVVLLLVLVLAQLQESRGWIQPSALSSPSSSSSSSHQKIPVSTRRSIVASNTRLFTLKGDEEEGTPSSSLFFGSSSRRRWFQNIVATTTTAATTATAAGYCFPVNAASTAADDVLTIAKSKSICDPTVSIWKKDEIEGGRLIYLLGTAHISESSAELAGTLVRDIHPSGVFVELDMKRVRGSGILAQKVNLEKEGEVQGGEGTNSNKKSRVIVPEIQMASSSSSSSMALSSSTTTPETTTTSSSVGGAAAPAPVKKPGPLMRAASAAVGNGIRGMYKKLDSTGFKAGEEFTVAIKEGQQIGSDIVLGDRDVEVTLNRLAESLAKTDLNVLLNPDSEMEQSLKELFPSPDAEGTASKMANGNGDLSDEEFRREFSSFVETIKTKDNVRKIMAQLQKAAPALYEALVTERDAYMAAGLNGLNELQTIVAVMGIAHVDGVENNLKMNGWKNVTPTNCSS